MLRLRFLVLLVSAALLAMPSPAQGHWQTAPYTWNNSSCAEPVDPVNMVFWENPWWDINNMEAHAPMSTHSGSTQWFYDHDRCAAMDAQTANGCGACTRTHIRVGDVYDPDPTYGWMSRGDAHYEVITYCGHATSSFNEGRNWITNWLVGNGGHSYTTEYWGNTLSLRQCNGNYVASDGWAYWWRLTHYH